MKSALFCFWEDDGQDEEDSSVVRGGPNGSISLSQARENYRAFGGLTSVRATPTAAGQKLPFNMSLRSRIGLVFICATALTVVGLWLGRELSIDGCLDRGGSWDYDRGRCVVASP